MKNLLPLAAVSLLAAASVTGCVTATETDVTTQPAPAEDPDYGPVLAKSTQARTIFKDFETRYMVSATYLSPEFRAAFARRLAKVYLQDRSAMFEEANAKAGFFVSIETPSDIEDKGDLSNPQHWTVLLGDKQQPIKPILVKRLNDKERWRAFFPAVSPWTYDYLVVFDAPSVDPHSAELVEKTGVTLTFANADAKVELSW